MKLNEMKNIINNIEIIIGTEQEQQEAKQIFLNHIETGLPLKRTLKPDMIESIVSFINIYIKSEIIVTKKLF
jgi:dihydroneopterin aldolase